MTVEDADLLLAQGEPDEAARICNLILNEDPDHAKALYMLGRCFSAAGRYGLAANMYERVLSLHPNDAGTWNNLGFAYHTVGKLDKGEEYLKKALSIDPVHWHAWNNLISVYAATNRPKESIEAYRWAMFSALSEADRNISRGNVAQPQLGLGNWSEGWDNLENSLGDSFRRERRYANEKRWNGEPGKKVVFYGEQGIGDEIMFGSILPDALEDVDGIIECDRRLEGLFKRTFPHAVVHGTRFDKDISWPDAGISHRCAFGSLGRFYRRDALSFPRKPYLETCPLRRKMYRSLLDSLPGRKIGIAWTGGTKTTRSNIRSLGVEDVERLARDHPEVSFVSLEYKDTGRAQGVHEFQFITRSLDYDDTAALVAELDGIISVTTAVALLAGAVGAPCEVLVPNEPTWHWGYDGEMPWFDLNLHRGKWDLEEVLGCVEARKRLALAAE